MTPFTVLQSSLTGVALFLVDLFSQLLCLSAFVSPFSSLPVRGDGSRRHSKVTGTL